MLRRGVLVSLAFLLSTICSAQVDGDFPPLEQWHMAILRGDTAEISSFYSVSPPAQIKTGSGAVDLNAEYAFWTGLKPESMNISVVKSGSLQAGIHGVLFQAGVKNRGKILYVTAEQIWQQQGQVWRMVAEERDITKLEQPLSTSESIYPAQANAREEVRAAERRAAKSHRRVLVVFGADWCYDCHVLDKAFHRKDIAAVLVPNYEVVHVDVGKFDKNQDLANEYGVPLKRGVPAIAILDAGGKVLYSQRNGEWERARALGPEDLIALLRKWKPRG